VKKRTPITVFRGVFVCFVVLGAVFLLNVNVVQSGGWIQSFSSAQGGYVLTLADTPSAATTPPPFYYHLPLVFKLGGIELNNAWTSDAGGVEQSAFLIGDTIQYGVELSNFTASITKVTLTWFQTGPCGDATIMDQTFKLKPGVWETNTSSTAPNCLGIYTNEVELTYGSQTLTLTFQQAVIPPSSVVTGTGQGFDKCTLPSVDDMQTWWDSSPYSTVNIYLGGVSAFCAMDLNPAWLYQVSQQGWSYVLTWVGPQASCSGFKNRMSADPAIAYQQGRDNAETAASTASHQGMLSDKVIYYDLESYSGADDECRAASASFLQGWVERLHELGFNAGAYGAPCTSYITDWAANDSPPDDVWIAHWYTNDYDPDATVWDEPINIPCLSDDLWVNSQRIKQYAGGHSETWGGVKKTIDSNVLDGQVNAILGIPPATESQSVLPGNSSLETLDLDEKPIRGLQLLSPSEGWVLQEDQLLWTSDGGSLWEDITPGFETASPILGATFLNTELGWFVQRDHGKEQFQPLKILSTIDGGATWQSNALPISTQDEAMLVETAFIDFVDASTGWVVLKLQSSSNFSLGRLYATEDGGRTWRERTLPLGEPVMFLDAARGWVAGGPRGDQLYRTEDGGKTWQNQYLPDANSNLSGQVNIGLPVFSDGRTGMLPVTLTGSDKSRLLLYSTDDSGTTWRVFKEMQLDASSTSGGQVLADLDLDGDLYIALLGSDSGSSAQALIHFFMEGELPSGVVSADFVSERVGWTLVQEGACSGYKPRAGENNPPNREAWLCESHSRLLMTTDGGLSWHEISPLD
jgi:photosystem II stability/assembly factor-like uncharacterized protein